MSFPGFIPVSTYLTLPRGPETWLIEPLIPASGKGLLYSPPKVGKSALAIQLAEAVATGTDWMGFPVGQPGKVLYLQLDTPGTTWALRFDALRKFGLKLPDEKILLADMTTLEKFPFDILQPGHVHYLHSIIQPHRPVLVIIDTIRKLHSGDENSSTVMSNVMTNLVSACHPAAVLVISHDKKPSPDMDKDIMADHRGSTAVVGEMDAILRLTKSRLYYAGRNIEEGSIKMIRQDCDDALLWMPDPDEYRAAIDSILNNDDLVGDRAKARALAPLIGKSPEAARSILRRAGYRLAVPKGVEEHPVENRQEEQLARWFQQT